MDHSKISGFMWVAFGVFMLTSGVVSFIKEDVAAAVLPFTIGTLVLGFQFYVYKKTGSVKGVF
jgi:hypothetical protein